LATTKYSPRIPRISSFREFHYRWEWQLQSSPEALWPLVADTNRFNRDTGVPSVTRHASGTQTTKNAFRRLSFSRLGATVDWEEEPFEWTRPQRFGVVRRYLKGPLAEMRVLVELTPQPSGGSRLVYQVWVRPRNLLGVIAVPLQIGIISARSFDAMFRRYDQLAIDRKLPLDMPVRVDFAPGGRARLEALRRTLLDQQSSPELVGRLVEMIEHADDLTVAALRPHALADHWGVPRRSVLELFLLATRAGLLEFRWELLCPLCRGDKKSASTLSGIQAQVHCDVCNVDFSVNFDQSVELTFHPNPAVRQVASLEFCIGGPQVTPHIAVQQLLAPGSSRSVTPALEAGRYRLRTLSMQGGQFFTVAGEGLRESTFRCSPQGWPREELQLCPTPSLHFENATCEEQLFILERMAWSSQLVTAADVTGMQLFRDLFSSESLRPGEQISVGRMTLLFTDLLGSTRMYREIGDAPAFGCVMNHFDILRDAVSAHEGAVIKTIGDSVMAVFPRPVEALKALAAAQDLLASPPAGSRPLLLKGGIHYGPCIAVTLNDRLDYFGSSVNFAARLAGLSSGRDMVISDAVRADPEVSEFLTSDRMLAAESFVANVKGFDEERFELWRVFRVRPPGAETAKALSRS
jgi:class 3 adenylate cyclase